MVTFDGPVNGEEVSEIEEIGVSNMYFYLDGISSYDIPFKPKGFELRLGYSFMNWGFAFFNRVRNMRFFEGKPLLIKALRVKLLPMLINCYVKSIFTIFSEYGAK